MEQEDKFSGINRRQKMIEYLEEKKEATVKEFASLFLVSEMTIRRDFHYLEDIGVVEVHYGGARLSKEKLELPSFSKRDGEKDPNKYAIGRMAAGYIKEGDTIFLDVSSTVFHILPYLPDIHLTVITNSMPVIERLYPNQKIRLMMAPGVYDRDMAGAADFSTIEYIRKFHADKAFIGGMSCIPKFGVACSNELECAIKQQMWRNSDESYLMVDHRKFTCSGPVFQNALSDFSYILTDSELDEEMQLEVRRQNRNLIICNR